MHGHVGRSASVFVEGKSIEMASITRSGVVNEWRHPEGNKTPGPFDCCYAVAEGVDKDQPTVAPGDVMGHHRASDVSAPAKESDVVLSARFDLGC